jgi:methylaspartate ammonia-lyase
LPLQGSSGHNRYENADKMIVRRLAALPHSQVDHIESQVGLHGEHLLAYARWLRERLCQFGDPDYRPIIHLDVHGAIGKVFDHRLDRMADFLLRMHDELHGLSLRVESVALADSRDAQIRLYMDLKNELARRKSSIWLVADEWANQLPDIQSFADAGCVHMIHIKTPDVGSIVDIVDATLYCKQKEMPVLLGGSCIETSLSTRATIHVAMVTRPAMVLIKPGMGIDEGYMLCQGEMARIARESQH